LADLRDSNSLKALLNDLMDLARHDGPALGQTRLSEVTNPLLAALATADLGLSGELVYLTATLIQLKSKLLLPQETGPGDIMESLSKILEDPEFLAAAAGVLEEKRLEEQSVYSPPRLSSNVVAEPEPDFTRFANLPDYLDVFRRAVQAAETRHVLDIDKDPISIGHMISWLETRLSGRPFGPLFPSDLLFEEHPAPAAKVALFLAMLELSRRQALYLEQPHPDDVLMVRVAE
jgi:segregation and condensation protein A